MCKTEQRLVDTFMDRRELCWCRGRRGRETSVWLGHLCGRRGSPVVEATPVYSGDTASAGELAEETPAEWTERAGE